MTAAADVDRDEQTFKRTVVVDGSLTCVDFDGQRVAVDDAETAAARSFRCRGSRSVDDPEAGWKTVQLDSVRVVVNDPRLTYRQ